jgi:hypothetical protein
MPRDIRVGNGTLLVTFGQVAERVDPFTHAPCPSRH